MPFRAGITTINSTFQTLVGTRETCKFHQKFQEDTSVSTSVQVSPKVPGELIRSKGIQLFLFYSGSILL